MTQGTGAISRASVNWLRERTWLRHAVTTARKCVARTGRRSTNLGRQPDPESRARRGDGASFLKILSPTLIGSHFSPQIAYDRFNRSIPDFRGKTQRRPSAYNDCPLGFLRRAGIPIVAVWEKRTWG
jgi:hypothetical protein